MQNPSHNLPPRVRVTIEIPRWSFTKYALTEQGGHVEFVSPLPCPFNYGFVRDIPGGDGMPLDAIVMGRRLSRSSETDFPVVAIVRFIDNGAHDDKLVCSITKLGWLETAFLKVGFRIYVLMKRVMNMHRKRDGATKYLGLELVSSQLTQ